MILLKADGKLNYTNYIQSATCIGIYHLLFLFINFVFIGIKMF